MQRVCLGKKLTAFLSVSDSVFSMLFFSCDVIMNKSMLCRKPNFCDKLILLIRSKKNAKSRAIKTVSINDTD